MLDATAPLPPEAERLARRTRDHIVAAMLRTARSQVLAVPIRLGLLGALQEQLAQTLVLLGSHEDTARTDAADLVLHNVIPEIDAAEPERIEAWRVMLLID